MDWVPQADWDTGKARMAMYRAVRDFFQIRAVQEVETPILSSAAATDLHLSSFVVSPPAADLSITHRQWFLQTSPEYPMKRLLAAGSGAIFQICKVFRCNEQGRHHNPEFSMLEWYRPGFSYWQLMQEVESLVQEIFQPFRTLAPARSISYRDLFEQWVNLDITEVDIDGLHQRALDLDLPIPDQPENMGRDGWLDLILSLFIQPKLSNEDMLFVYDYPASQSALAHVRQDDWPVAERFELFLSGIEVANGYQELTDAEEQKSRFHQDLQARRRANLMAVPEDEHLIGALNHGLPHCSGVALGLDRCLMLMLGFEQIQQVISFPIDRA